MSEEKPTRPVGIIARADVGNSAENLSALTQLAQGIPADLSQVHGDVKDAVDSVRALDSLQGGEGMPSRYQPVLREAMAELRREELVREVYMGEAEDRLRDIQGRTDMGTWQQLHKELRIEAAKLARVREAIRIAEGIRPRRFPWGRIARRLFYGPTGNFRGWVREGVAEAHGRLKMLADYAQAAGYFALFNEVRRAAEVAENYEEGMSRFAVGHGMDDPGRGNPWQDAPYVTGDERVLVGNEYQEDLGGIGRLRSAMMNLRQSFLGTGAEAIGVFEGLGDRYNRVRGIAATQFARRTGEDPAASAQRYGRTLLYMHEGVVGLMPQQVEPGPPVRLDAPEKTSTYDSTRPVPDPLLPQGLVTQTRTISLQQLIGDAAVDAGEEARVPLFAERVADFAQAMGVRVGLADAVSPVGLARWSAEAGLFERPEVAQGMMSGAAAIQSDTMLAAKLAAVRRFLPHGLTVGGGPYAQHLDPKSFRQARTIIESGDPETVLAYARYAEATARENGLGEDGRSLIFERLTGLGPLMAKRVLDHVEKLDQVRTASLEKGLTDRWVEGPLYRGASGGSYDSLGRIRGERDALGHQLGLQVLEVTYTMREAMIELRDGVAQGKPFVDAIEQAVGHLSPAAAGWTALDLLTAGHTATAAALGATWGQSRKGDLSTWEHVQEVAMRSVGLGSLAPSVRKPVPLAEPAPQHAEPPRPHPPAPAGAGGPTPVSRGRGLIQPVEGGRFGQALGPARYWDGAFSHSHAGLDIYAPLGTPVRAAAGGKIVGARNRETWLASEKASGKAAGIMLVIAHPDGTRTRYLHLDGFTRPFRVGDQIQAGEVIGAVGKTGIQRDKPHLHFEHLDAQGQPMDPRASFPTP